jgi:hypothetical protein
MSLLSIILHKIAGTSDLSAQAMIGFTVFGLDKGIRISVPFSYTYLNLVCTTFCNDFQGDPGSNSTLSGTLPHLDFSLTHH